MGERQNLTPMYVHVSSVFVEIAKSTSLSSYYYTADNYHKIIGLKVIASEKKACAATRY